MLEISIICVIALAAAYWMALFLMGRREDVLHGDFIRAAQSAVPNATPQPAPRAAAPRPLLQAPRPTLPQVTTPQPTGSPRAVTPALPAKRIEPVVMVKTVDPVQPAQPVESLQPAASIQSRAASTRPADIMRTPRPTRTTGATAPALRRTRPPEPAKPDILQSLLETIKRDLGDAVSR
jgi:hypothetical protein